MISSTRSARWVAGWVRWYTRGLPEPVATARRAELASDLYEQSAQPRERPDHGALARALRGVPADVTWARAQSHRTTAPAVRRLRVALEWWAISGLVIAIAITVRMAIRVDAHTALAWDWEYAMWTAWNPYAASALVCVVIASLAYTAALVNIAIGARSGARWLALGNVMLVVGVFYGKDYIWEPAAYYVSRVLYVLGLGADMAPALLFGALAVCSAIIPLLISRRLART